MILDDIVVKRKEQLNREKLVISLDEIKKKIEKHGDKSKDFAFSKILIARGLILIAEVKKGSPSKGIILEDFNPVEIAINYEKAGAGAISVLTEEKYFLGRNEYLEKIRENVNIPILRKDFIIDEYQIYHSKYLGAAVILLIVAILDKKSLTDYLKIAQDLGLDVIVEVHTEDEIKTAIEVGAKIIGINNRNLKTFEVDLKNTQKLLPLIPEGIFVISESGIKTAADIIFLKDLGVSGVLIGETLMRSSDIGRTIEGLGL
ncbi:MAG: indole-3-glycerol phosphate synthase TrpC [Firmicutes bacterium]|nr:indole-3-glycerol phosphate synthase TrpC [Bacillota bacterium]